MSKETQWESEKNRFLNLPLEEKRKLYKIKNYNYLTVGDLEPWCKYALRNKRIVINAMDDYFNFQKITLNHNLNKDLSEKVSLYKGDITMLEVDAIVNASNSIFYPGGGVEQSIHNSAGELLLAMMRYLCRYVRFKVTSFSLNALTDFDSFFMAECKSLGKSVVGDTKITGGYNLPAKYVIHTVGPKDGCAIKLQCCYHKCLSFVQSYQFKSIAFPCISTGAKKFPKRLAAHTALRTVREFLENNSNVDRIIFCTLTSADYDIYETLMHVYFPIDQKMQRLHAKIRIARRLFTKCKELLEEALKNDNMTDIVALYEKLKGHRSQLEKLQTVMVTIMIDEYYDDATVDQDVDAADDLEVEWFRLTQKVKESRAYFL